MRDGGERETDIDRQARQTDDCNDRVRGMDLEMKK